jgi:hypothetical protein
MPDGKDMVGVASFEAMTFQSSTLSLVPCTVIYANFWLHDVHFPFSILNDCNFVEFSLLMDMCINSDNKSSISDIIDLPFWIIDKCLEA